MATSTVTADQVTASARRLLQDASTVTQRWTTQLLVDLLNEAQLALVALRHDAHTRSVAFPLIPGTRQSLSDTDYIVLIRAVRNLGVAGNIPGRVISMVSMEQMDASDPLWHSTPESEEVLHAVFDERSEDAFYVWPKAKLGTHIELVVSVPPTRITKLSDNISLPDVYAPALAAYICYAALAQDMDNTVNRELVNIWYAQFTALLMGKDDAEAMLKRG